MLVLYLPPASNVQLEAVVALLKAGADINAVNGKGETVLDVTSDPLIEVILLMHRSADFP